MDWDKLRIFHVVAEAGSFTQAGAVLDLSQSAISRQVSALERELGTPLFYRHSRGLALTESGEYLLSMTQEVAGKIAYAADELRERITEARGDLVISSASGFGAYWLLPHLKGFIDRHSQLNVTVNLEDGLVPLSHGDARADVAIRFLTTDQEDLIQRKLFTVPYRLVASHRYLTEMGAPIKLEELAKHRLIAYDADDGRLPPGANWHLSAGLPAGETRKPYISVNNMLGVMKAAEAGIGIGLLPAYLQPHAQDLVTLLTSEPPPMADAFIVYGQHLRSSPRVTALRDYLIEIGPESLEMPGQTDTDYQRHAKSA